MRKKALKYLNILIEANIILAIIIPPLYFACFYKTHSSFQIDKAVVFKILTETLLLLSIFRIIIRQKISLYISRKHFYFVWLFFSAYLLAVIFSSDIQLSVWGSYWRQQGLIMQFHYLLFFILLSININNKKQIERILNWLVGGSTVVCFFGILQFIGIDFIYNGLYKSNRITSTLGQPVFFGNYLVIIIPFIFYKIIKADKKFLKYLFFLVLLLNLFCLYLTYTRGAWLGFLAGLFLYLLIYFILFRRSYKKILFSLLLILMIFSGLVFLGDDSSFFIKRIKSFTEIKSGSLAMRLETWKASAAAISERPFFGYGPETQNNVLIKYYNPNWSIHENVNTGMDRAHNLFLDLLLQGGLFYFTAYFLFIIYLFLILYNQIKKNKKNSLPLFIFVSLASYGTALLFSFEITETAIFFWMMVVFAFFYSGRKDDEIVFHFSKLYYALILPALILVYFSVSCSINTIRADYYFRLARNDFKNKNYTEMFNHYLEVFYYNEKAIMYKWFFANDTLISMSEIQSNEVLVYLTSLINTGKTNKSFDEKYTEATIYKILGKHADERYFEKAENLFKEMAAYSPLLPDIYRSWGDVYYLSGDYKKAINLYNIAINLLPSMDSPYLNLDHKNEIIKFKIEVYRMMAMCHNSLGEINKSGEAYRQIIKADPYQIDVYKKIADAYYQSDDLERALWYNQRGFMLSPNDYFWPYAIALLYEEAGDPDKAKEYANKALILSPDNKDIIKFINELNK